MRSHTCPHLQVYDHPGSHTAFATYLAHTVVSRTSHLMMEAGKCGLATAACVWGGVQLFTFVLEWVGGGKEGSRPGGSGDGGKGQQAHSESNEEGAAATPLQQLLNTVLPLCGDEAYGPVDVQCGAGAATLRVHTPAFLTDAPGIEHDGHAGGGAAQQCSVTSPESQRVTLLHVTPGCLATTEQADAEGGEREIEVAVHTSGPVSVRALLLGQQGSEVVRDVVVQLGGPGRQTFRCGCLCVHWGRCVCG